MLRNGKHLSQYIRIHGLVQGVGFRPFIYRLAKHHGLNGWVENRNDAVHMLIQGSQEEMVSFVEHIRSGKPLISHIDDIEIQDREEPVLKDFEIRWSRDAGEEVTEISPDIAVCDQCLQDMADQPHRKLYPFTNCTNCGPRFSIIRDLPYDRVNTTMDGFAMCPDCDREYHDVLDRRFHAQPIACNHCGPVYEFIENETHVSGTEKILSAFTRVISNDGVIMAKGLGGFFLACDALNETAVTRLRNIKRRYSKPFAVMFSDTTSLQEFAKISPVEMEVLNSWQRPVVILEAIKQLTFPVTMGFPTIGALMPYLPVHYLLFEKLKTRALVFTSGNFSEEPILIDDDKAVTEFKDRVDGLLINNRPIYNRVDDSIIQVVNEEPRLLRRSRGYVPSPIFLNYNTEGLLAAGAELVNCFCIGKDHRAILSQHIGDLKNFETLEFYEESFERFIRLFRITPKAIACDLHPDYLSTRYAGSLNIPVLSIQHHHAHIASCMAEYGLDEKVIGVSMDGTGLGTDGNIWGSEFLIADLNNFERITHFEYMPMPGGDMAILKPWRMALSYLFKFSGSEWRSTGLKVFNNIPEQEIEIVIQSIQQRINTPLTCGAGRIFDVVAVLLGLLEESGFHAEAPMRLESVAAKNISGCYSYDYNNTISFDSTLLEIISDINKGEAVSRMSAKFHNTIIQLIIDMIFRIRSASGINKAVLSGGIFQNKYILSGVENRLKEHNFNYYSHKQVPSNDGGIALGQLYILAKKQQ